MLFFLFDISQPGVFKEVQAIGWWLAEANIAQVSINLTDMDQTLVHEVFEECKRRAEVSLHENQGWTLAPVRPPAAGNFGVGRVHSEKYPSGWRVTFLTN